MSRGRRIALIIVVAIVALVLTIVVIVPRLVDLDRYRTEVVARIEQQTGRPAAIGRLELTFSPSLAVRASDFALGNPAGFPSEHFVEISRIDAELDASALWHREVVIRSLKLDHPVIRLVSTPEGRWNFENPSPGPIRGTAYRPASSSFSLGVIAKVILEKGDVAASRLLPSGRPDAPFFEMQGVSAELDHVDLAGFGLSASTSPPDHPALLRETALELSQAQSSSLGQGTLEAKSLRFGSLEATRLKSGLALDRKQAALNGLTFDLYEGRGRGDVSLDFGGANLRYGARIELRDVDMARLLAAFPGARGKLSGKMSGDLNLVGENTKSSDPLAGKQGRGELTIRDGKLPTLELNKNLLQLDNLIRGGSYGDPSSFSSLSADLEIAGGRISSRKITIIGRGVDVDAQGSLALAGAGNLDYEGVAKIAARENQLTNLLGGLLGSKVTGGKLSFPFGLQGTFEHPRFLMRSGPLSSPVPGLIH